MVLIVVRKVLPRFARIQLQRMTFHFASKEYANCFRDLPQANNAQLRQQSVDYLASFDAQKWYQDPVVSLLKGQAIGGAQPVETTNALGQTNGHQILAQPQQVQMLKDHISSYQSPYKDLRKEMRAIETKLLSDHAGFLIGNQCVDFCKQDGITEMEESVMANVVEQRLNDLLLLDEAAGQLTVNRQPIYVSCVSNFTNFLDLFRKTIRSLEVGVPCVVLSRSNTSQHPFRWTQLLINLMQEHKIDPGMVTFASCSLDDIKDITQSCLDSTGNLYTTCSRQLAADIMATYPKTVASTGGPNTMVVLDDVLTPAVRKAIQTSASIESSGQCTALRHCVVTPKTAESDVSKVFETLNDIPDPAQAVRESLFDGVFAGHKGSATPPPEAFYTHSESADAYYKIADDLPAPGINEYWRKVVVDFSLLDAATASQQDKLASWLNENQPISLAINGPRARALKLGIELFGKTAMVVNTIGSSDDSSMPPALTCQARPQEAEVFGEFPPRSSLLQYTRFPVVVPSSNPSYDATYTAAYLKSQLVDSTFSTSTQALLSAVTDPAARGYCVLLIRYLQDVCRFNPKHGFGKSRTAVWGLQRPPLGSKTVLCCEDSSWDDVCPIYTLFHVTNAKNQVELSVNPKNDALLALCMAQRLPFVVEDEDACQQRMTREKNTVFHVARVKKNSGSFFPMVGNFVSLYLPLGHIKSTKPEDDEFVLLARVSGKWLNTNF